MFSPNAVKLGIRIKLFKTTPRMDDDICMSGQKFVLNTASGVRRQFMFINDKVYLAFIH